MKTPRISEAIGNLPEDLVSDAVIYKRAGKKKAFVKWGSIAACFMIMIMAAAMIIPMLNDSKPSEMGDYLLPAKLDEIIWDRVGQLGATPDDVGGFAVWNGWRTNYALYEVLNRANNTDFIAVIVSKNDPTELNSFEYKGKTLAELHAENAEVHLLANKLIDFHKEGEWLKYGELLYTTGTPGGEKWSKSFYDERVAFYGEAFLAKYIVDGKVQTELLNKDYDSCQTRYHELSSETDELIKVYHESYVNDLEDVFLRSGACTIVRNGKIFLFVQKDELARLKVKDKDDYLLLLATRAAFEGESNSDAPTLDGLDTTVTGFDLNKIGLSNVEGCRTGAVTNEEDLYAALNDLIGRWENLMITIGSDNHIAQSELEEMNYSEVQHWQYPTRTVVIVKCSNLNIEALKELTLREDVSFVWVSEQLVAIVDNEVVESTPDGD